MTKYLFSFVFIVSLVFSSPSKLLLKEGDTAPLFSVKDLANSSFPFYPVYKKAKTKKGLIIIDFWATWCKPCLKELPVFEKIHKELKAKGIEFYAISADEKRLPLWKFIKKEKKFTFNVLFDQNSQILMKKFSGPKPSLPLLIIIDSNQKIKFLHVGGIKNLESFLKSKIEELKPGSFPTYKKIKISQGETVKSPTPNINE